jgi:hypothetical protein
MWYFPHEKGTVNLIEPRRKRRHGNFACKTP